MGLVVEGGSDHGMMGLGEVCGHLFAGKKPAVAPRLDQRVRVYRFNNTEGVS